MKIGKNQRRNQQLAKAYNKDVSSDRLHITIALLTVCAGRVCYVYLF